MSVMSVVRQIEITERRLARHPRPMDRDFEHVQRFLDDCRMEPTRRGALRGLPDVRFTGLSSVTARISTTFGWTVSNNLTGGYYNAPTSSTTITKTLNFGTAVANAAAGGGDEVFSFQQAIVAGGSATIDINAMTNQMQQASVSIARFKSCQLRLLSASDDSTISPAPNSASTVTITNAQAPTPTPLIFATGGSGLTVTLTASGAVTAVAIGAAGTGYPPSTSIMLTPVQAGGSNCQFAAVTNASGVPTSVMFITGAGGAGYSSATVPTVAVGQTTLTTGNAIAVVDVTAAGVLVSSTQKKFTVVNNDQSNGVTIEVDFFGATT